MKFLNLLIWVGQFGFSLLFPLVFFLCLATWLRTKFHLGIWITVLFGILGLLTSISTTKSCILALQKAAEEASSTNEQPIRFNDHN